MGIEDTTKDDIEVRIKRLEAITSELDAAGDYKAECLAAYDLAYAKAMARLSMGKVTQIDGQLIDKASVTLIPKYAAGMCHEERAAVEIATNRYKSLTTKISVLSATLNAKQSIFRYLTHF